MKNGEVLSVAYQVQVRPQGNWVDSGVPERYDTPAVRRAKLRAIELGYANVRILETRQTVYPPDGKEW